MTTHHPSVARHPLAGAFFRARAPLLSSRPLLRLLALVGVWFGVAQLVAAGTARVRCQSRPISSVVAGEAVVTRCDLSTVVDRSIDRRVWE